MNMDHVHIDKADDADEKWVSDWLSKRGMRAVVNDSVTVGLDSSAVVYFPGGRDPIVVLDGMSPEAIAAEFSAPLERAVAVARLRVLAQIIERYAPVEKYDFVSTEAAR